MKKLIAVLAIAAMCVSVAEAGYSSGSCTAGKFKVTFSGANFVTGLGWSTGAGRTISYSGSCSGCNIGPVVYGWHTNPLIEYYVGGTGGSSKGTYSCDGRSYTFATNTRYNAPSIQGTKTFVQYIARGSRSSPINYGCHSYNWQRWVKVGTHNYQVVMVEGWSKNSGSATVSVSGSNWYTHWVGAGSASFKCGG